MPLSERKAQLKLGALRGVGRNVVVLGLVSLLTDVSSEMLYPLIPLYLTGVLHTPMSVVGLIEGLAESTAALLKLASGRLSDRWRRRLPFVFGGYGLSAASKPLLALATTWPWVLAARLIDRTGKGLRGPARDAMIAAATPPERRGIAFGLHRALDTTGAVLGPMLGLLAIGVLGLGYRTVFLLAAIPAFASILMLLLLSPRPVTGATHTGALQAGGSADSRIDPALYRFLVVVALFSLGNSSNVFLLLRARDLGWSDTGVIGLYVFYNLVYAIAATPAGHLSDRIGRRRVLLSGFVVFALVYAGFALAKTAWVAPPLLALYGLYAAATAGAGRAYVADLAGSSQQATAMGLYQMVTGVLLLAASSVAGLLWSVAGPAAPFWLGAATAALAAVLLMTLCDDPGPADSELGNLPA